MTRFYNEFLISQLCIAKYNIMVNDFDTKP